MGGLHHPHERGSKEEMGPGTGEKGTENRETEQEKKGEGEEVGGGHGLGNAPRGR